MIKRSLILLSLVVILMALVLASKEARASGPFFSGGVAYAPSLGADGHSYTVAAPLSLRGGYWFHVFKIPVDSYLEYQQFQVSDSASGLLSLSRLHQELSAWVRYRYPNKWRAKPYAALGAGASQDQIKTHFNGMSTLNTQSAEPMFGGAIGVSLRIVWGIEAQLEGRVTSASSFQPNPLLQMGVQLGYRF